MVWVANLGFIMVGGIVVFLKLGNNKTPIN
jgi:hypothetical protein